MGREKNLGSRDIARGLPCSSNMFAQSFRCQSKRINIAQRIEDSLQILTRNECSASNGRNVNHFVPARAFCDATLQKCLTGLGYENRKLTHACFWRTVRDLPFKS